MRQESNQYLDKIEEMLLESEHDEVWQQDIYRELGTEEIDLKEIAESSESLEYDQDRLAMYSKSSGSKGRRNWTLKDEAAYWSVEGAIELLDIF